MYPYGNTTVSSIINEGVFGIDLMKYSESVGKVSKTLKINEGLFGVFITTVLSLKQNQFKQYLINKLLNILKGKNIIAVQNNWFGIMCRISIEYNSENIELKDYIEFDIGEYMVKGLIEDLKIKVSTFVAVLTFIGSLFV